MMLLKILTPASVFESVSPTREGFPVHDWHTHIHKNVQQSCMCSPTVLILFTIRVSYRNFRLGGGGGIRGG